MKLHKKVLTILLVFLMSCSLTVSALYAPNRTEDEEGNTLFTYTVEEQQNLILAFEELKQWREIWPQYELNYNNAIDSGNIWRNNYIKESAMNYDLRFQRNVMIGISGALVIVTTVVLSFFKK